MAPPALFGQMVVMKKFWEGKILTQICGNGYMPIKASPPLVTKDEEDIDLSVDALDKVMADFHTGQASAKH